MTGPLDRRATLKAGLLGAVAGLAGCEQIGGSQEVRRNLEGAERLTRCVQRALPGSRTALAPEYRPQDVTQPFHPNGSTNPQVADYVALRDGGFRDYQLIVDGLVRAPLSLSLEELRAAPSRTQITRHDCVEGWSVIGRWKGARLSAVLNRAGLLPSARYVVFHCFDRLDPAPGAAPYYESVDLVDAFHPQTILAYDLNDRQLPVSSGAPLRVRIERQLGYKMAKYIRRIEVVESFAHIAGGRGGFWPDRGYEWYAGI